jgi:acyl-CoA thioester hydrolase
MSYSYRHRVAFFETDAMGVVHHSNYIRFMELARVDWLRGVGVMDLHIPHGDHVLGVLNANVEFKKPCRFDDEIEIFVEGRIKGARLWIRYAIWLEKAGAWVATGETELALLTADRLQPTRFSRDFVSRLEATPLSQHWPPAHD